MQEKLRRQQLCAKGDITHQTAQRGHTPDLGMRDCPFLCHGLGLPAYPYSATHRTCAEMSSTSAASSCCCNMIWIKSAVSSSFPHSLLTRDTHRHRQANLAPLPAARRARKAAAHCASRAQAAWGQNGYGYSHILYVYPRIIFISHIFYIFHAHFLFIQYLS